MVVNLVKEIWTENDKQEFLNFLENNKNPDIKKIEWQKNLLKTNMQVLGFKKALVNDIAKQICKGNAKSFLNLKLFNNYEASLIYGCVISNLQSFNDITKYLDVYLNYTDSWAHTDALSFKTIKEHNSQFLKLANKYIASSNPFVRRTSLIILLQMIKDKATLPHIFKHLNSLGSEEHYYVNMAGAWLLCEAFIQYKPETIEFLSSTTTNNWLLNKAIQKCRESFRVSDDDKQMLLDYKKKTS